MTPLNHLAPLPFNEDEVTAEAFLRHHTVSAAVHEHHVHQLAAKALEPGAPREDIHRYVDAVRELKARFGLLFLLRRQIDDQPSQADEVVTDLWALWQDDGVIPELLGDWLRAYDIDPKQVAELAESGG